MKVLFSTAAPTELKVDLLGVLVHEDVLTESPVLEDLDHLLGSSLRRAIAAEHFVGKIGQTLSMHTQDRVAPSRILLLGAGRHSAQHGLRIAAGALSRVAATTGATTVGLHAQVDNPPLAAQAAAEGLLLGRYRFDKYLSQDRKSSSGPEVATLLFGIPGGAAELAGLGRGQSTASAVVRARDLVNEPASVMTPTAMARVAEEIARTTGVKVEVLGREECAREGLGMFLAVAQGSAEEPRFIHLAWAPPGAKKRIVLVGKGVTFDSGGLSLKSNENMLDMKMDMSGAAAVMAAIEAAAAERLPVEVHALAACTENMPGGRAYKLGDVLRSMSGKTVEINNTDAEGRLTLGDAISYGVRLKPDAILDFATLTGACMVALGPHTAGVMSNDDTLATRWLSAAQTAGEDMWRLPLPERLHDQLKSEIADMRNTGERWGGALTAGLFLKEFAGSTPWVHTDIAGPASTDKDHGHVVKGGTGFAVATILEYLRSLAG